MSAHVNRRSTLHRGRAFTFEIENVTLSNGLNLDLEIVRHPGAVAIVALAAPETVVMIQQYRHALGEYIWEIPAGTLAAGEDPLACARRELTEETGYEAAEWQALGIITPVPAYSDERIHLFLASGLKMSVQRLDPDEQLSVHPLAFADVLAMIDGGAVFDAKSVAGILRVHQRRCMAK